MGKKKKPDEPTIQHAGIQGGHRDAAEALSTDYYLTTNPTGFKPIPELMDMDTLTANLEQFDPIDLLMFLSSPFGKGFLMGMLHQTYIYNMLSEEYDEEGED